MSQVEEEWRMVDGFGGRYMVSSTGRVARILKGHTNANGYQQVALSERCKTILIGVHQLVARAFIGPANGLWVHHRDDVKAHNYLSNLEYVTPKENTRRAFANGLIGVGENHHFAKLTKENVREIRRLCALGEISQREIGENFGVSQGVVSDIYCRRTWKQEEVA